MFIFDPDLAAQQTNEPWLYYGTVTEWYHVYRDGLRYGDLWFMSEEAASYYIQANFANSLVDSTAVVNELPAEERENFFDNVWTAVLFEGTLPPAPVEEVRVPKDGDPDFVVDPRKQFPEDFAVYEDAIPETPDTPVQDDNTGTAPPDVPEGTAPPPSDDEPEGEPAPEPPVEDEP